MRVLCLHGKGTSGDIFRSQTAALRAKLDGSVVFDFVDSPFPCAPAPGIDKLFDTRAGTFAWFPTKTPETIRAAHLWLDAYLASHGPYDAAMGFSQGCMLLASYLMHRMRAQPSASPPFRGVVFICGGLSLTSLEMLGVQVPPRAWEIQQQSVAALHQTTRRFRELAERPERIPRGVGLWDDTSGLVHELGAPLPAEHDVFGMDLSADGFPRDLLISLPTVHVYSSRDPRYPAAVQLAYACPTRRTYDHWGGHEIPRTTEVSARIAELVSQLARDIAR